MFHFLLLFLFHYRSHSFFPFSQICIQDLQQFTTLLLYFFLPFACLHGYCSLFISFPLLFRFLFLLQYISHFCVPFLCLFSGRGGGYPKKHPWRGAPPPHIHFIGLTTGFQGDLQGQLALGLTAGFQGDLQGQLALGLTTGFQGDLQGQLALGLTTGFQGDLQGQLALGLTAGFQGDLQGQLAQGLTTGFQGDLQGQLAICSIEE
jgi:hypothetical protein